MDAVHRAHGGTIPALSVASAAYPGEVIPLISQTHIIVSYAGITLTRAHLFGLFTIVLVTYANAVGVPRGATLENIATWAKFRAMAAFTSFGIAIGKGDWHHLAPSAPAFSRLSLGVSPAQFLPAVGVGLIAVFWAFDGWVYITWVAGEVREPRRNVPLAMVLGVVAVGVIDVSMNLTYLYALPVQEIAKYETIAHAAATVLFSSAAARWLSALIAVSCFGAMASCTLSGARVYFAMARDGVFFQRMAHLHPKWRSPPSAWSARGSGRAFSPSADDTISFTPM
jgi:APA family basic amino acid/polyamine antiporter